MSTSHYHTVCRGCYPLLIVFFRNDKRKFEIIDISHSYSIHVKVRKKISYIYLSAIAIVIVIIIIITHDYGNPIAVKSADRYALLPNIAIEPSYERYYTKKIIVRNRILVLQSRTVRWRNLLHIFRMKASVRTC